MTEVRRRPYLVGLTDNGKAYLRKQGKKWNAESVTVLALSPEHAINIINDTAERKDLHFTPDMLTVERRTK